MIFTNFKTAIFSLIVAISSINAGFIHASPRYTVTDIISKNIEGDRIKIRSAELNNQGAVITNGKVITYAYPENIEKPINFIWDSKNGFQLLDSPIKEIARFNDSRNLVGIADNGNGRQFSPFFSDSSGFHLIELPSHIEWGFPMAINSSNQVLIDTNKNKYFLWDIQLGLNPVALPKEIGSHFLGAEALNDKGQILFVDHDKHSSFVLEGSEIIRNIPESNGFGSEGIALNNQGDIVGTKFYKGRFRNSDIGMVWLNDSQTFEIAIHDSNVKLVSINENREAVGNIAKHDIDSNWWEREAFFWDIKDGMRNLNELIEPSSDLVVVEALAINNHGQILARARNPDQMQSEILILLTPIP